jgi:hypothetical protein
MLRTVLHTMHVREPSVKEESPMDPERFMPRIPAQLRRNHHYITPNQRITA